MSPHLGNGLDLPFEEQPRGPMLDLASANLSGGVVIMAAAVEVMGEQKPALVFRFATPTGQFYEPTILICDDDQLLNLPALVTDAVTAARKASE